MALAQQPTLPVKLIDPSVANHRTRFDPESLKSLEAGVKAAGGILEPIVVRPVGDGRYKIIAGERRWRVARKLYGEDYEIPVVVREATDAEAAALGIIENHHREDVSLAEQARGASSLLHFNRGDKDETALQLGWSLDTLERRLLLLACTAGVLDALVERRIHLGHAELLAGLPHERQDKVLAGILEHKVSVEVLKKQLGQFARRLADAVFDTAPCANCPHNSAKQSGLFDESLGDGYCQHPEHYEELTLQAVEAQALPLRERFPVVKIVKATDGFIPLPVQAEGELGVGAEQYGACQGCANFGCSVSAMPGSYGQTMESLCFDPVCNAQKVVDHRKAQKVAKAARAQADADRGNAAAAVDADNSAGNGVDNHTSSDKSNGGAGQTKPVNVGNETPPRVVQYRIEQWRKWVANALMGHPERNHCTLAALVLSSNVSAIDPEQFLKATGKLVGKGAVGHNLFKSALEQADAFERARLPTIVQAVAASAAFRIDVQGLEVLLNYLEIDESRYFVLNADYLQLLTISELESLADELKLKKAMGERYKKARAGKKDAFIDALLKIEGITYAGLVPKAMRFARRKLKLRSAHASADAPVEQPVSGALPPFAHEASESQACARDDVQMQDTPDTHAA
jgi:PRTRC genetic system ParB family protein